MKFIPYNNKIEVEPITKETVIDQGDEKNLQEMGKVVSIGATVTFVKVGDTIFFDSWGCIKTADGRYVVPEDPNVIIGKYESEE